MPFRSSLPEGRQRFLAHVVEHALESGLRSPEEFLRHFSVASIMRALAGEPERRAAILEATVGLKSRIGLRKSPESAGEDLQIALDEGETTPAAILETFAPDDRVRFLDNQDLWVFEVAPRWWSEASPTRIDRVRQHTAFVLERGVDEGLLSHREIVAALGIPTLVDALPPETLARVLERALEDGRDREPFTDKRLLETLGWDTLCEHVPLTNLWEWVIIAKIAARHGLLPDIAPLFDAREAHPDASQEVTVIIGPDDETQVAGSYRGNTGAG
jgi:hypothetical protein